MTYSRIRLSSWRLYSNRLNHIAEVPNQYFVLSYLIIVYLIFVYLGWSYSWYFMSLSASDNIFGMRNCSFVFPYLTASNFGINSKKQMLNVWEIVFYMSNEISISEYVVKDLFSLSCKQIVSGLQVALLSQKLNRRRRWKTVHHAKVWISVYIL